MKNKFFNFLGLTKKAGKLVEGYNKCEDAIKKGNIHLLILADELAENSREKFKRYCSCDNVYIIEGITKEELGLCLGRAEVKVICVNDKNMSDNLIKLWKDYEK